MHIKVIIVMFHNIVRSKCTVEVVTIVCTIHSLTLSLLSLLCDSEALCLHPEIMQHILYRLYAQDYDMIVTSMILS